MLIPNFGASKTILNPVNIFCRWYKLNLGVLQGQVKLYHFMNEQRQRDNFFYFLYKFLEIIDWKRHWTTILDTDLDSLLPFKWNWMRLTPE